jgi:hypothetical protein
MERGMLFRNCMESRESRQVEQRQLLGERVLLPDVLAAELSRWALRREKHVFLIDIGAAKQARALAAEASALAERRVESEVDRRDWSRAWLSLRERVAEFLAARAGGEPPISYRTASAA